MAASLLKGLDYEEAVLLLLVFLVLRRARPAFDRRAAFFDTRFSAAWIAAVAGALGASVWLGLFAFKHVDYSHQLWWQFEIQGEASRFLRASVGAALVLLLFGLARLLGYAPHEAPTPTTPTSKTLVERSPLKRRRFRIWCISGTRRCCSTTTAPRLSCTACRGAPGSRLAIRLDQRIGSTVSFAGFSNDATTSAASRCSTKLAPRHLHRYVDFGLTFVKLGEEAKVDLTTFTLEGSHASKYRQVIRRLEKDGGSFRIIESSGVRAIMGQLRTVSDDWLAAKASAEKGFSLGFFDEAYVSRFPVAVIELGGRIQAFANIWAGPQQVELSIDLMRYHRDAPKSVMEALFVHTMKWGKEQGYQRFALGMAPLSGFEDSPVASLWNRLGAFLYEHGDSIYNFQGLRAYKDKFNPNWEPHYLAYPGGLRLPHIMADVSALVAGGYRRIFRK